MIFDTHCHAYWRGLETRHEAIRSRMDAENVVRSVQVGTDWDTNQLALAVARRWGDNTWCAAAMHPTTCQNMPAAAAAEWTRMLEPFISENSDKVIAVGETGLDYYHLAKKRRSLQKEVQRAFFIAQAELAQKMNLPLVIHTRDAAADTVKLIMENRVRNAVIHCFSEDAEFAGTLCDWSDGIYFSFSGILTYRTAVQVQDAARFLPLDRILVETDAPFLVPEIVKGQLDLNEPGCTRYVMDFLKKLRPEPADVVEHTVWMNSNRFFGIE